MLLSKADCSHALLVFAGSIKGADEEVKRIKKDVDSLVSLCFGDLLPSVLVRIPGNRDFTAAETVLPTLKELRDAKQLRADVMKRAKQASKKRPRPFFDIGLWRASGGGQRAGSAPGSIPSEGA